MPIKFAKLTLPEISPIKEQVTVLQPKAVASEIDEFKQLEIQRIVAKRMRKAAQPKTVKDEAITMHAFTVEQPMQQPTVTTDEVVVAPIVELE
jgi:hypothetical protein